MARSFTLLAGVRPLPLVARVPDAMAFDSAEEFSRLEGLWFDRTGVPELVRVGSFICVGVPLRPIADGGMFVCPVSVAAPGAFSMEARLSEGFNLEIDGEDVTQGCILELSGEAFRQHHDSSSGNWRSRACGRRTRPPPGPPCKRSWARSQLSGDAEQEDERMETPRGTLPIIGTSGGGVRSAVPQGISSRNARSRASELGCDSTRLTRSFLSTARGVSRPNPAWRMFAQLGVSNHSTVAANSRATSHNT